MRLLLVVAVVATVYLVWTQRQHSIALQVHGDVVLHESYARLQHDRNESSPYGVHSDLFSKLPNLAVPLRRNVIQWIAGVPLTPFKAPYEAVPLPDIVPSMFRYNAAHLTPNRNQGYCGACFVFAVCNMLSDRLVLQTGGVFSSNLSVQQILDCFDRTGCEGGSPEDVCMWLATAQPLLLTDRASPYKQSSGGAVTERCPTPARAREGVRVKEGSVVTIARFVPERRTRVDKWTVEDTTILADNIRNMKAELLTHGPFYAAMTVYADLYTFSGTTVYRCEPGAELVGGHAIEIIGYCDAGADSRPEFKTAYWWCRNSWSDAWPTQSAVPGYFAIEMGVNMCGIESRCGAATPQLFVDTSGSRKLAARIPNPRAYFIE